MSTSSHYSKEYLLDISSEQFVNIALVAVQQLGWHLGYTYRNGFVAHTNFVAGVMGDNWSEEIKCTFDGKNVSITSISSKSIAKENINERNVEDFIRVFQEVKSVTNLNPAPSEAEEVVQETAAPDYRWSTQDSWEQEQPVNTWRSFFKPRKRYFVTPLLIAINVLIFLVMIISGVHWFAPQGQDMINWGANYTPDVLSGQWWRLVSSCFLHFGILHLAMNMYALLFIGMLLEPLLGSVRFAIAYLIAGITGSIASLWWHDIVIGAGASGAIFGMYGLFLALLTTNLIEKNSRQQLLSSIGVFVGYNLLIGSAGKGIDNAAHIGGLLGGMVIGYATIPSLRNSANKGLAILTIVGSSLFLLIITAVVGKSQVQAKGAYYKKVQAFVSLEQEAINMYPLLNQEAPSDQLLPAIEKIIDRWEKASHLMDEAGKLPVSADQHLRSEQMMKYSKARLDYFQLLRKAVIEDTNMYEDSLDTYDKRAESILKELNEK